MKKTMAQAKIEEMTGKGYTYHGMTTGLVSWRKGSNMMRKIEELGLNVDDVTVESAAHLQHGTQGWQLLIFTK